jgi:hypothetical protein
MPENEVTVEAVAESEGTLKIYRIPCFLTPEGASPNRLRRKIERERSLPIVSNDGQTYAIDADRVTEFRLCVVELALND